MNDATPARAAHKVLFLPKSLTVLTRGYALADLRADALAGLTVAVVALPLAMALAIASGTTPDKGLHTAIVAGFLISLLGGSRVQIGGPTAAFIPVVYVVIVEHGYGGMILCTLLAGLILIAAGLLRMGALMRFMPRPVVTGFTAGIAVSIALSQVKDGLGLSMGAVPAEFWARTRALAAHLDTVNLHAVALCALTLTAILWLRARSERFPSILAVVVVATLAVTLFGLPVETIGARFGSIPSTLPRFELPEIPFDRTFELLPAALTIAFLAGVESLLSAVVADGMTGGRHRSNTELIGQGIANSASALFGGLPATGALARTATNIRAGARTPVAGMLHALFLLLFMLLLAPLMVYVPLPALAGVLLVIAWNMSERKHFMDMLRGPVGDRVVLLATFGLTVMFDLTMAIEVGVVLAALLFMHRMAETVAVGADLEHDLNRGALIEQRSRLPADTEAFMVSGPIFFASTAQLDDVLETLYQRPRWFVLRLEHVPLIDASGADAVRRLLDRAASLQIRVLLCGLRDAPRRVLAQMGVLEHTAVAAVVSDFDHALTQRASMVEANS